MKIIRIFSALITLILALGVFTSCDLAHQHNHKYYLIKSPSCSEEGVIKIICLECGDMELKEIAKEAHTFYSGRCSVCGIDEKTANTIVRVQKPIAVSHDNSWDIPEIYETACTLGCDVDYETFVYQLGNTEIHLKAPSLDMFGSFSVTATAISDNDTTIEVPIIIPLSKLNFKNDDTSVGYILRIDIDRGNVVITYTDGTQLNAGTLRNTAYVHIEGFGITESNEFVFYYSDDTIAYIGTLRK